MMLKARQASGKWTLLVPALPPEAHNLTHLSCAVATRPFSVLAQFGARLDQNLEPRFLEQVKLFYNEAANLTGIDEQYLNLIKACQTVVRFNIPLRRDDGTLETITCYR